MSVKKLAELFRDWKVQKERLQEKLVEAQIGLDETEERLLEAMIDEGVASVDLGGVGKFSVATRNFLSVNQDNMEGYFEWLRASGRGALIKDYINPRTNGAFLSEYFDELVTQYQQNGMEPPAAESAASEFIKSKGVTYFSKKTIQFRKEKA